MIESLVEFESRIARLIGVGTNETPFPPSPETGVVLVVEDEPTNRKLLMAVVKGINLKPEESGDGLDACEMIEKTKPAAVLLDIMIPGIDGFEVCRRIKNNPETAGIPVIMVTGLQHKEMAHRGLAAGADGFITKPFDTHEIALRLRNALRTSDSEKWAGPDSESINQPPKA